MGLSVDDLYDMTPRSFQNKLIGFNQYREQVTQNDWERTRIIVHACLSPHSKKQLKPKQILPFPWDNKHKPVISSKKKIAEVTALHEEFLRNKQK